ncbi:ATP-grasp domain-containing protein [Flaviaesturariibacter terrae]
MIPAIRQAYNAAFTQEKYTAFIEELSNAHPGQLDFRVAETPIFVPRSFKEQILSACESIVDAILDPSYHGKSDKAIPPQLRVPREDGHPQFIAFDFGICYGPEGSLEPQLIEMQGFPSLFAYQVLFPEIHARHFGKPPGFSTYLGGFDKESYIDLLRRLIVADEDPENVILLEIFPEQQKTRVDFAVTKRYLGIETVCLTQIIREGRKLFYEKDGRRIRINRIYNRLIFDDLHQQSPEVQAKGALFQEDLDVTWVPHPNWFYRLSKFSLPFIDHPYVPKTRFLNEVDELPQDLENYVVKPLFSFAGQGVIIDVTPAAIAAISDKENWILQRKVPYAPVIQTPGEPAKAEIRIFYFWEPGAGRPVPTSNLARLSKGKMVGVRYNKDKDWVGGTFCLFEED